MVEWKKAVLVLEWKRGERGWKVEKEGSDLDEQVDAALAILPGARAPLGLARISACPVLAVRWPAGSRKRSLPGFGASEDGEVPPRRGGTRVAEQARCRLHRSS